MAKRPKRSKKPPVGGRPPSPPVMHSTSTSNPPASQDVLPPSSAVAPSINSRNNFPTASSSDLVGDIIAKSAVAPSVHTLLRMAPGRHAQAYEDPSVSTSCIAGPASSKNLLGLSKQPGFKNVAGNSRKPTGATKSQPAARKKAVSSARARGPSPAVSRQETVGSQQSAEERGAADALQVLSSISASESTARPMKRRACSQQCGPRVPNVLRPAESSHAPMCSTPTNDTALALQGVEAPVLAFSGEPMHPPPQWGFPPMQVPAAGGPTAGPAQFFQSQPEVPSASDPPIEDAEMEDLSDVIDENLQNQVPLAEQQGTFVITDTNIFLSNLNLVKRLTSLDSGPPDVKVCIPWMAIQELDHIKNRKRGSLTRSAVEAIAYINKALVTKNPKFRGQTIAEARAKEDCVPQNFNNNDDHFIHCCIVVMNTGNRVILLSNDINLRNKALINNIQSFSAAELETILDREFGSARAQGQPGTSTGKKPAATSGVSAAPIPVAKSAACAEVRAILRRSLNLVLESELLSAFGDLWPRVVVVKPPWTEETALECILRHWIALTGMAFKSSLKKVMENLLSALRRQHLESSSAGLVLQLSLVLCSDLQVHYYPLAGDVARLRELYDGLRSTPKNNDCRI